MQEICNKVAIIENGHLVENGEVNDIFNNPKSKAARRLIYGEESETIRELAEGDMKKGKRIRITFSKNSAFEPVIANMIIHFQAPVNILSANTRNVGGIAKGEMILGLPPDKHLQLDMEEYLRNNGLQIQEVDEDV